MSKQRHLDVGCGRFPRNPFDCCELHGVDIFEQSQSDFIFTKCNVVLEKLPYKDSYFDSVSAYDFIEHIPRLVIVDGRSSFPFVDFMSEVFRVLKPGGVFYAITPAFPKRSAFVDPTHVNYIAAETYKYFTQPDSWAAMYGFNGCFAKQQVKWVNFDLEVNNYSFHKKLIKHLIGILFPRVKQHILWCLKAIK